MAWYLIVFARKSCFVFIFGNTLKEHRFPLGTLKISLFIHNNPVDLKEDRIILLSRDKEGQPLTTYPE